MVLGILDCDEIAPELREEFDSYGAMFENLIRQIAPNENINQIRIYKVCDGDLPKDVSECQAYLVTGSKTGVYDIVAWREPLRRCVSEIYDMHIPMVGVCFGHQLLADVLGGEAIKSDKGWGIGAMTHSRQTQQDVFQEMPESITLLYSHQDQVVRLPPTAVRLYGSDFCPNAAFCIPGRVLGFQGHPEFTVEYSQQLMSLRESLYPPDLYKQAVASLQKTTDERLVSKWITMFLTNTVSNK